MREELYEESVRSKNEKGKQMICKFLLGLSVAFAALALLFAWRFMGSVVDFVNGMEDEDGAQMYYIYCLINTIIILGSAAIAIVCFIFRNRANVGYDYSYVSGSITVSKVYNDRARKFYCSFTSEEVLKVGKVGSETYQRLKQDRNNREVMATPNKTPSVGKNFYYVQISTEYGKRIYVFECREKFMVLLLQGAKRGTLEEDFQQ